MVTSSRSATTFIPADLPVQYELQSGGRVLLLKRALQDPATKAWHDIRIERTGWFKWFRGPLKDISQKEAEQIRKTYDIVLRTCNLKPGEEKISCDFNATKFSLRNDAGGLEKRTSYAYREGQPDTELSREDAAYFHKEHMTVHDAMVTGILNPLGVAGADVSSDRRGIDADSGEEDTVTQLPNLHVAEDPNPASQSNPVSNLSAVPNQNVGSKKFDQAIEAVRSDAQAMGDPHAAVAYDDLPDANLRKQRLVSYLDKVGPIAFSAFINNTTPQGVDPAAFQALHHSLDQLAVRDALGQLAALEARLELDEREARERDLLRLRLKDLLQDRATSQPREAQEVYEEWRTKLAKQADAKYMQQLLEHWFRAVYHFLDKESHPEITEIALQLRAENVPEDQLVERAKEIYWRRYTPNWIAYLRPAMPNAAVLLDSLSESISQTKLKPAWW